MTAFPRMKGGKGNILWVGTNRRTEMIRMSMMINKSREGVE